MNMKTSRRRVEGGEDGDEDADEDADEDEDEDERGDGAGNGHNTDGEYEHEEIIEYGKEDEHAD